MPPLQPQLPFHPGSQAMGPTCLRVCWWAERARDYLRQVPRVHGTCAQRRRSQGTHTLSIQSLWPAETVQPKQVVGQMSWHYSHHPGLQGTGREGHWVPGP